MCMAHLELQNTSAQKQTCPIRTHFQSIGKIVLCLLSMRQFYMALCKLIKDFRRYSVSMSQRYLMACFTSSILLQTVLLICS